MDYLVLMEADHAFQHLREDSEGVTAILSLDFFVVHVFGLFSAVVQPFLQVVSGAEFHLDEQIQREGVLASLLEQDERVLGVELVRLCHRGLSIVTLRVHA